MNADITASPRARAIIADLKELYGRLSFHMSGRYGTTLVCLRADELRLGARDVLMGEVEGTPLYMMSSEAPRWSDRAMIVDVMAGHAPGFSLESGEGLHFFLLGIAACGRD